MLPFSIFGFNNPTKAREDLLSIIVFLIVLSTPGNIYKVVNFSTNWGVYCETGYVRLPCKATEFAKDFRGNIFNMYEWGVS